jgi:hypothetical protein
VEKKTAAAFRKLKRIAGLSDEERYLFARSLTATPQIRWERHQQFLRSTHLSKRSEQKRFGLLSSE